MGGHGRFLIGHGRSKILRLDNLPKFRLLRVHLALNLLAELGVHLARQTVVHKLGPTLLHAYHLLDILLVVRHQLLVLFLVHYQGTFHSLKLPKRRI